MIYLNAFLFAGFICMLGQIILDNTKLTPGHITSLFTVVGALLSFCGIYPTLIQKYQSGINGYENAGILGIFSELLDKSSLAIVSAIIFAFIISIIFKAKK